MQEREISALHFQSILNRIRVLVLKSNITESREQGPRSALVGTVGTSSTPTGPKPRGGSTVFSSRLPRRSCSTFVDGGGGNLLQYCQRQEDSQTTYEQSSQSQVSADSRSYGVRELSRLISYLTACSKTTEQLYTRRRLA
jgi:hypothetical protein